MGRYNEAILLLNKLLNENDDDNNEYKSNLLVLRARINIKNFSVNYNICLYNDSLIESFSETRIHSDSDLKNKIKYFILLAKFYTIKRRFW